MDRGDPSIFPGSTSEPQLTSNKHAKKIKDN
ncbi:uncharacterized protein METZ01_LOCUS127321 [marine metagenome]|uniref:Uncharacterized protein n=1 Tax=marine metagenome TaxID=408172 RepID=A0A381YDG7_9ZZZZ